MNELKKNSQKVYSTETGKICPECLQPKANCSCRQKKINYSGEGSIRIRREVKGRRGKTMTVISGIPLQNKELSALATILKQKCSSGGSVKDGLVLIQGNHVQTIIDILRKQGYSVKQSGG